MANVGELFCEAPVMVQRIVEGTGKNNRPYFGVDLAWLGGKGFFFLNDAAAAVVKGAGEGALVVGFFQIEGADRVSLSHVRRMPEAVPSTATSKK